MTTAPDGQRLLDQITGAVIAADFETYARHTAVPLVIVCGARTIVLSTIEMLRHGFESTAGMYRTLGATSIIRRLTREERLGPKLMSMRFQTHVMRNAERIVVPYECEAIARREGDDWKVAMLADSLANEEWPIVVPEPDQQF